MKGNITSRTYGNVGLGTDDLKSALRIKFLGVPDLITIIIKECKYYLDRLILRYVMCVLIQKLA